MQLIAGTISNCDVKALRETIALKDNVIKERDGELRALRIQLAAAQSAVANIDDKVKAAVSEKTSLIYETQQKATEDAFQRGVNSAMESLRQAKALLAPTNL